MKYIAFLLIVEASVLVSASPSNAPNARKVLPSPSGPFAVSRIAFDWTDSSRQETAVNDPKARREIMVYIWYPADKDERGSPAAYFPGADKIASATGIDEVKDFWGDVWAKIVSGRITSETLHHAAIAAGRQQFPLLVFSPGLGLSSTAYTSMIEEVVSQGYVVASIEPTYEVGAVALADGRVITERPEATGRGPAPPGETKEQFLKRLHAFDAGHIEKWAKDTRYVIDQVSSLNNDAKPNRVPFARRIDIAKIGAWGHSFGGRAAARACQIDQRIKACLDADGLGPDGPIFAYEGEKMPVQPFMWMEVFHEPPTDAQLAQFKMTRKDWDRDHQQQVMKDEEELRACPGGSYHVSIKLPGIDHFSFTDQPFLTATTKESSEQAVHALQMINRFTTGYFDKYLKNLGSTVLDSSTQPEGVSVERFKSAQTGVSAPH